MNAVRTPRPSKSKPAGKRKAPRLRSRSSDSSRKFKWPSFKMPNLSGFSLGRFAGAFRGASVFWWIVPAVVAVLITVGVYLLRTDSGPDPRAEAALPVRVVSVPAASLRPSTLGYGRVQPAGLWFGRAGVSGKAAALHPSLQVGAVVQRGEILVRIEPEEVDLKEEEDAIPQGMEKELNALDAKEKRLRRDLKKAVKALELAGITLETDRRKAKRDKISQEDLNKSEAEYNKHRKQVQSIQNQLAKIPIDREKIKAGSILRPPDSAEEADMQQAAPMQKGVLLAPFECRITKVNVKPDAEITVGQVLVEAKGTAVSEIAARFALDDLRRVLPTPDLKSKEYTMEEMKGLFGVEGYVRPALAPDAAEFRVISFRPDDEIDIASKTLGFRMRLDETADGNTTQPTRYLRKDAYMEVEFHGPARPAGLILPTRAVRNNSVQVVDENNRLQTKQINIEFTRNGLIFVELEDDEAALQAGDMVVVSDFAPAVEGMLLKPIKDEELQVDILAQALGEEPTQ